MTLTSCCGRTVFTVAGGAEVGECGAGQDPQQPCWSQQQDQQVVYVKSLALPLQGSLVIRWTRAAG